MGAAGIEGGINAQAQRFKAQVVVEFDPLADMGLIFCCSGSNIPNHLIRKIF